MSEQERPGASGSTRPGVATGGGAAAVAEPRGLTGGRRRRGRDLALAAAFLTPALLLLGALVLYPIVSTVVRSMYDRGGDTFVGIDNYREMLTSPRTLRAIRNNAIWVVVGPTVVTALGLMFAVLTERIRWSTAFKFVVFMPMAISFLAAGVIFRLVYEAAPERGLANAALTSVVDLVRPAGALEGARPATGAPLEPHDGGFAAPPAEPDTTVFVPLVGLRAGEVPEAARDARAPSGGDGLQGVVWLDFTRGGGGTAGEIDPGEPGLPGVRVEAFDAQGTAVGSATTNERGQFALEVGEDEGPVRVVAAASNFRERWNGVEWLGPALVTPSLIGSYVWIWAGFAMVLIAAGLAAIPRDALEAARVDGANEWQVFRRVTVPMLAPVLLVVMVTLVINVLKVFDLVLIIPPGTVQDDANVLALEMWRVSFGGGRDQGLGSALGVFLFLLVMPAMAFNMRRFRSES